LFSSNITLSFHIGFKVPDLTFVSFDYSQTLISTNGLRLVFSEAKLKPKIEIPPPLGIKSSA